MKAGDLSPPAPDNLQTVAVTANDAQVLLTRGFQTDRLVINGLGVLDVREQVVPTVSDEGRGPALSPDGRLIAYASMQSGRSEIYLQPWPELDKRVQVSTGGGTQSAWSRVGKMLYYRSGEHIYATGVQFDGALTVGQPVVAFKAQFNDGPFGLAGYEPDGAGGIIAVRGIGAGSIPNQIEVFLNFFTEIERLAPSRRK